MMSFASFGVCPNSFPSLTTCHFSPPLIHLHLAPPPRQQYARHLMVAVDGSKESERASEWAIKHLCRSGVRSSATLTLHDRKYVL